MARMPRVVVPGLPHHICQRGNRRQRTFFSEEDYRLYKELLASRCAIEGTSIWAYCLMPNHVHLIAVPTKPDGLARAIGEAHRRYTREVNSRGRWTGYLWQGRFASFPMDELHLSRPVRYVLMNPVRSGLAPSPSDWPHSSWRAHVSG